MPKYVVDREKNIFINFCDLELTNRSMHRCKTKAVPIKKQQRVACVRFEPTVRCCIIVWCDFSVQLRQLQRRNRHLNERESARNSLVGRQTTRTYARQRDVRAGEGERDASLRRRMRWRPTAVRDRRRATIRAAHVRDRCSRRTTRCVAPPPPRRCPMATPLFFTMKDQTLITRKRETAMALYK